MYREWNYEENSCFKLFIVSKNIIILLTPCKTYPFSQRFFYLVENDIPPFLLHCLCSSNFFVKKNPDISDYAIIPDNCV